MILEINKNLILRNFKSFLSKTIIPATISSIFFITYYFLKHEFRAFSFIGLVISLLCLLLALILFANSTRKVHVIWGFFNISVAIWGWGCFLVGTSYHNYLEALFSWKLFVFGITFIPVFCYHFISEYCCIKSKIFLYFCYAQAIAFSFINIFSNLLVDKLVFKFNEFYYLKANFLYSLFFLIWIIIVLVSFINLYRYYRVSTGLKRIQSAYLFYGMMVGFIGGSTTAPLAWDINIYPAGHFLTCFYAAVSTYAIFKYQLIDIKTAITRISLFLAVYTIVLGIPFAIAFGWQTELIELIGQNWWIVPLLSSTALATAGPFMYLHIQKKAEDRLLSEQRQYQSTLRKASLGMGVFSSWN